MMKYAWKIDLAGDFDATEPPSGVYDDAVRAVTEGVTHDW
jgi:hypothetical protein